MNDRVEITAAAQNDFENIYLYISETLCNKQAALRLMNLIDKSIRGLAEMPEGHPLVKDEYLRNKGIRFVSVKNYIIFYTVDESMCKIYVVRILYGKRNWADVLQEDL